MAQCSTCDGPLDADGVCQRCSGPAARPQGNRQTTAQPEPQAGHRYPLPTGVKLLCGVLVLSGLGSLAFGLQLQSMSRTAATYGAPNAGGTMGLAGLLLLAFGAVEAVAAVGLWTRTSWGWTAGMCVAGCGLLTSLLLLTSPFASAAGLLGVLYSGGVGWYVHGKRWLFAGDRKSVV